MQDFFHQQYGSHLCLGIVASYLSCLNGGANKFNYICEFSTLVWTTSRKTRQQLQICQLFVKLNYLSKVNLQCFFHQEQRINIFWILTSSPRLQNMPPKKSSPWIFRVFTPTQPICFCFCFFLLPFRFGFVSGNAMQVTPHCVANRDINLPNVRRDPSRPTSPMPAMTRSYPKVGLREKLHKHVDLHPGRLTWNLQITHLERKMIFQTSLIMFHVNLQGCSWWLSFNPL